MQDPLKLLNEIATQYGVTPQEALSILELDGEGDNLGDQLSSGLERWAGVGGGFLSDVWTGVKEEGTNPENLPLAGTAVTVYRAHELYDAAQTPAEQRTPDQHDLLQAFFIDQAKEGVRQNSSGYLVGSIATQGAAFSIDFAATGGLSSGLKGAAKAGAKAIGAEALEGLLKKASADYIGSVVTRGLAGGATEGARAIAAKGVGKLAGTIAGQTGQAAVREGVGMAANPIVAEVMGQDYDPTAGGFIGQKTWEAARANSRMIQMMDPTGKLTSTVVGSQDEFIDALPQGIAEALVMRYAEAGVGPMAAAYEGVVGPAVRGVIKRTPGLRSFASANVAGAMSTLATRMGVPADRVARAALLARRGANSQAVKDLLISGPVGEYFEERDEEFINSIIRKWTGTREEQERAWSDIFSMSAATSDTWFEELVAFSAMGGARAAAGTGFAYAGYALDPNAEDILNREESGRAAMPGAPADLDARVVETLDGSQRLRSEQRLIDAGFNPAILDPDYDGPAMLDGEQKARAAAQVATPEEVEQAKSRLSSQTAQGQDSWSWADEADLTDAERAIGAKLGEDFGVQVHWHTGGQQGAALAPGHITLSRDLASDGAALEEARRVGHHEAVHDLNDRSPELLETLRQVLLEEDPEGAATIARNYWLRRGVASGALRRSEDGSYEVADEQKYERLKRDMEAVGTDEATGNYAEQTLGLVDYLADEGNARKVGEVFGARENLRSGIANYLTDVLRKLRFAPTRRGELIEELRQAAGDTAGVLTSSSIGGATRFAEAVQRAAEAVKLASTVQGLAPIQGPEPWGDTRGPMTAPEAQADPEVTPEAEGPSAGLSGAQEAQRARRAAMLRERAAKLRFQADELGDPAEAPSGKEAEALYRRRANLRAQAGELEDEARQIDAELGAARMGPEGRSATARREAPSAAQAAIDEWEESERYSITQPAKDAMARREAVAAKKRQTPEEFTRESVAVAGSGEPLVVYPDTEFGGSFEFLTPFTTQAPGGEFEYPFVLDIRNPKRFRTAEHFARWVATQGGDFAARKRLQQAGHDGVQWKQDGEPRYVVLSTDQYRGMPRREEAALEAAALVVAERFSMASVDRHLPANLRRNLTDKEKGQFFETKLLKSGEPGKLFLAALEKIAGFTKALPSKAAFKAAAIAGRAKKGWYRRSAQGLLNVFGNDREAVERKDAVRFAQLLAALSPQTSVEWNLRNSASVWRAWVQEGRPTDAAAIQRIIEDNVKKGEKKGDDEDDEGGKSAMDAWINNGIQALAAEDPSTVILSGPKVDSFWQNLVDNVEEVTNDTWMARFANQEQKMFSGANAPVGLMGQPGMARSKPGADAPGLKGPGYLAMNAMVRQVAKELSRETGEEWTPENIQETIWSFAKTVMEKAENLGTTVSDIVFGDQFSHEEIGGTVDFSMLLEQDEYVRDHLNRAGLDPSRGAVEQPGLPEGSPEVRPALRGPVRGLDAQLAHKRWMKEKISVQINLTAATESIPEIKALLEASAQGHRPSQEIIEELSAEHLKYLLSGYTGLKVETEGVIGVFDGAYEPAIQATVTGARGSILDAMPALSAFGQKYNQWEVHQIEVLPKRLPDSKLGKRFKDGGFATTMYEWELESPMTVEQIEAVRAESGLIALNQNGTTLSVYYAEDPSNEEALNEFRQAVRQAYVRLRADGYTTRQGTRRSVRLLRLAKDEYAEGVQTGYSEAGEIARASRGKVRSPEKARADSRSKAVKALGEPQLAEITERVMQRAAAARTREAERMSVAAVVADAQGLYAPAVDEHDRFRFSVAQAEGLPKLGEPPSPKAVDHASLIGRAIQYGEWEVVPEDDAEWAIYSGGEFLSGSFLGVAGVTSRELGFPSQEAGREFLAAALAAAEEARRSLVAYEFGFFTSPAVMAELFSEEGPLPSYIPNESADSYASLILPLFGQVPVGSDGAYAVVVDGKALVDSRGRVLTVEDPDEGDLALAVRSLVESAESLGMLAPPTGALEKEYMGREELDPSSKLFRQKFPKRYERTAAVGEDGELTKSFQRWFKDSAVTDAEGSPLPVYHWSWSDEQFTEFKDMGQDGGFHFGTAQSSRDRMTMMTGLSAKPGNSEKIPRWADKKHNGHTYAVYLSMQRPYFSDDAGTWDEGFIEALKDEGFDGVIYLNSSEDKNSFSYMVFEPNQIKSVNNRGTWSPSSNHLLYSVSGAGEAASVDELSRRRTRKRRLILKRDLDAGFSDPAPDRRFGVGAMRLFVDRLIDGRELVELAGARSEAGDFDRAERLRRSRSRAAVERLRSRHITPLARLAADQELTLTHKDKTYTATSAVGLWLMARHAAHYHKAKEGPYRAAALNDGLDPEEVEAYLEHASIAGMTLEEARAIKAAVEAHPKAETFRKIGRRWDRMHREGLKKALSAGLITSEEHDELSRLYPHYAPLRTLELVPSIGAGGGRTGGLKNTFRRGLGRQSLADPESVMSFAFEQQERRVGAMEKLRVRQEVLAFAEASMANLGSASPVVVDPEILDRRVKDGALESWIREMRNWENEPNTLPVIRPDGTVAKVVFDPSWAAVPRALKGQDWFQDPAVQAFLSTMMRGNNAFKGMLTRFSPRFLLRNGIRDPLDVAVKVVELGPGSSARVTRMLTLGYEDAKGKNHGLRSALRRYASGRLRRNESELSQLVYDFYDDGAAVTVFDLRDEEEQRKRLDRMMQQAGKGKDPEARNRAAQALAAIDAANEGVENSARLAAYILHRERRQTGDEANDRANAALFAKEVTTNFEQKGQLGPILELAAPFITAAITGNQRWFQGAMRSKRVAAAGMMALAGSFALSALMRSLSDVDDDGDDRWDAVPDYEKEGNLVFLLPGGKRLLIPMPYGFQVFTHAGAVLADAAFGPKSMGDALTSIAKFGARSLLPFDLNNGIGGALAPLQEAGRNYDDFRGRAIAPEPRPGDSTPKSQLDWKSGSPVWQSVAAGLNAATGGNKFRSGAVDIQPARLKHLAEAYTGGVGQFVSMIVETGSKLASGEELRADEFPLTGAILRSDSPFKSAQRVREAKLHLDRLEKMYEDGDPAARREAREDPIWRKRRRLNLLLGQYESLKREASELEKEGRDDRARRASERAAEAAAKFNRAYVQAKGQG